MELPSSIFVVCSTVDQNPIDIDGGDNEPLGKLSARLAGRRSLVVGSTSPKDQGFASLIAGKVDGARISHRNPDIVGLADSFGDFVDSPVPPGDRRRQLFEHITYFSDFSTNAPVALIVAIGNPIVACEVGIAQEELTDNGNPVVVFALTDTLDFELV